MKEDRPKAGSVALGVDGKVMFGSECIHVNLEMPLGSEVEAVAAATLGLYMVH